MLQRITAYLLIFSLVTVNFSRFFIYAGFELNKNYIATKLCENRNKPWLHCDGKCYFSKKIKQAEEKQASDERQSQKSLFQEVYVISSTDIKFHSSLLQVIVTPYDCTLPPKPAGMVFHPPQLG
ncbi:hypothetical protein SNE25_10895 [Mucilaginibacter sabulilitoris]|uniref:Uncharacterized protein n=1 Tax=Mucilaginibacter sabulilitoris TaxID=1173583 RepID=A0ABZ0TSE1_9SPHI|nr:hypothetical protein [Mucilaginibacter sabulilitoris]WPU96026.1 hypothetical protein SNE25_10895 [Mucilaginibacter sabulilitoris]